MKRRTLLKLAPCVVFAGVSTQTFVLVDELVGLRRGVNDLLEADRHRELFIYMRPDVYAAYGGITQGKYQILEWIHKEHDLFKGFPVFPAPRQTATCTISTSYHDAA